MIRCSDARAGLVHGLIAASALFWTGPASAEPVAPLSVEEVLSVPDVTATLTGPEGGIAWVERIGGTQNIFYRSPDGAVRQVTGYRDDDGQPIQLIALLTAPERILFRRGSNQNPANLPDPTGPKMLVAMASGGAAPLPGDELLGPDPDGVVVSPDRKRIAFTQGRDIFVARRDGAGSSQRLLTARSRVGGLSWSPDGKRLAYVVDRADAGRGAYSMVAVFDLDARRTVFMAPGIGADHNPIWSGDGRQVAFIRLGYQPRTWRFEDISAHAPFSVVTADAASGAVTSQWRAPQGRGNHFSGFASGEDYDIFARNHLFWTARGSLIFPWERSGFRALYALDPGGAEPRLLTDPGIEIDGMIQSPDRSAIIYWAPSRQDPDRLDLYCLDRPGTPIMPAMADMIRYGAQFLSNDLLVWREATSLVPEHLSFGPGGRLGKPLSTPSPALEHIAAVLPIAQSLSFRADDGQKIHATLYRSPLAAVGQRAPLIVHAHGGSRDKAYPVWQSFFGYPPLLRYFLSRGYHVLSVNYRSGTGYGLDYREPASYGAKGNGDVDDVIAAARYAARTMSFVDGKRIVAYGHSYGGHIVATALARSDVFAAGIDSAGVGDWVYEMESDSGAPLPLNIPERLKVEQSAWTNSAISQLDHWGDEPILFLHGDADRSAALRQTIELYQQLEKRGHSPEAVIFSGEAHALLLETNQRRYIGAVDMFLQRHGLAPNR